MRHAEYIREAEGSKTALLCIHGILGTPRHFDFLVKLVPNDVSVYNILLDGHGKKVRDLSRTAMKKWEKQISDIMKILSEKYENIIIVGHSMGTLLAIDSAIAYPEQVKALFLLAVPLKIHFKPAAIKNALKVAFNKVSDDDPCAIAAKKACSIEPDPCFWRYLGWILRYMELFAKIRKTRKIIPLISLPCLAYQSKNDELVSKKATSLLRKNPLISIDILSESSHYRYTLSDENKLKAAFRTLLRSK